MNTKHNYEQYKRLVKFVSSFVIVALEVLIYWIVWTRFYNKIIEFPFWRRGNWLMVALYAGILFFFLKTYGGLKIGYLKKWNVIFSQALSIVFANAITYIQIALLDKKFHSPYTIFCMTAFEILLVVIWAFLFQWVYMRLFPPRKLLVVYGNYPIFHIMDKINAREDKYQISGAIHFSQGIERVMEEIPKYAGIVVGDIPSHERNLLLKMCYDKDVRTYTIPKISDILVRTSTDLNLFDTPLLLSRNVSLRVEQIVVKRMMDIVFSAIGLTLSSPFFLFVALAIKCTDKGPVIYKQDRYTKDKEVFQIYKFRTMRQDAERDGVARLAQQGDDRITKIGRLLRATRLDELPQLLNVLRGEMSLVGPRPERPEIAEKYEKIIPEFAFRLKVKAGLTGYAQLYGKYNTTPYDKLKLDLTYIRMYSVFLDLKLIFMTPKILLMKESTEGVTSGQITATREEIYDDVLEDRKYDENSKV